MTECRILFLIEKYLMRSGILHCFYDKMLFKYVGQKHIK